MEHDAFHLSYLSDKIPEAVFHGQAVKPVAYLRVSTAQQDGRSQRLAILEYARKHDFRIDDFIEATASGQASEKRRRLDELMNVLQSGDRLVVSELSRLDSEESKSVALLKLGVSKTAIAGHAHDPEGSGEVGERFGCSANLYYRWSKEFLEAGKKRLVGDTKREATASEVIELRQENEQLKQALAEMLLKNHFPKNP